MATQKCTPSIVTNGLIFYLDAGNAKSASSVSSSWNDLSGYNNNGAFSGTSLPTYTNTNGGGIVFNGSSSYINVPRNSILEPSTGITLEATFKMTTKNIYNTVLSKPVNGPPWTSPYVSYLMRVQATQLQMGFDFSGTYQAHNDNYNYVINQIYHITVTWQSGDLRFYRNGLITSTNNYTGTLSYTNFPLIIGADYGASPIGDVFTGNIYNVRIYNRPLTPAEVLQNHNSNRIRFNL
jgi:Concanavalin A-like lectin/glucanases superfamily